MLSVPTNAHVEEEVIAFVAKFSSCPAAITRKTTLFGDLGIDGDDGDEILAAFMKRFQVNMSSCRPVHFGMEGLLPWAPLSWIRQAWIAHKNKCSTPESRAGLVPITVQNLIDSARLRQWTLKYDHEAGPTLSLAHEKRRSLRG